MSAPSDLAITSTRMLLGGIQIPRLGLGVFRTGPGESTRNAVRWAFEAGYRHVDSAHVYKNEQEVGVAVRASGIPRSELFVTTKLWNDDQGFDLTLRAFERSHKAFGLDQIDLYLMHWPVAGKRLDSWRAMERILSEGRVRAIGVSNFTVKHLEELLAVAEVKPALNQVELSPFLQQAELVAFCEANDIAVEAYSPLTKGRRLQDPRVLAIGEEVGKSAAQVLIRWSLQRGYVVIPKSANQDRIRENAAVFDFQLTEAQMAALNAAEENLRTAWDPTQVP